MTLAPSPPPDPRFPAHFVSTLLRPPSSATNVGATSLSPTPAWAPSSAKLVEPTLNSVCSTSVPSGVTLGTSQGVGVGVGLDLGFGVDLDVGVGVSTGHPSRQRGFDASLEISTPPLPPSRPPPPFPTSTLLFSFSQRQRQGTSPRPEASR